MMVGRCALLAGIAVLFLATGTAHAGSPGEVFCTSKYVPKGQTIYTISPKQLAKLNDCAKSVDAHALEDALRDEARERAEARALWKKAKHYGAE
jgi:hypothetical protein